MTAKRQMKRKEKLAEIVVGLIFILALVLLGVYTIVLKREALFKDTYRRTIAFEHTAAIQTGDRVLLRGYEIGLVKSMSLADNGSLIHVVVELSEDLTFYKDHLIEIRSSSILGGRHIYVELGNPEAGVVPGNEILHGTAPGDPLAEMSDAVGQLKEFAGSIREADGTLNLLINDRALYDNARESFASLKQAGDDVSTAARKIQDIGGRVDESFDKLDTIIADIKTATERFAAFGDKIESVGDSVKDAGERVGAAGDQAKDAATAAKQAFVDFQGLVGDVREGKGTLGKLAADDELYNDMRQAVADLRTATTRLNNEKSTLNRLMADDGALYQQVNDAFARLDKAMANLEDIGEQVKSGEGNLGKLVYDETLYQEIRGAVEDVRNTVNDFREQTPVSTFGSLVFGAL